MKSLFFRCTIFLAILTVPLPSAAEPQTVNLYTYHTHPPFMTGNGEGMTFDLATFLNQRSDGKFDFKVVQSSRPRINSLVDSVQWGVIPWVNPKWFNDSKKSLYLWSERVLMQDANAIISHIRKPVDYQSAQTLQGMIFGGIKGHKYTGIDQFISKGGDLRRLDADNHIDNFNKLLRGDIDVMLMPQSGALFSIAKHNFGKDIHISPTPQSRFERRLLIINHRRQLQKFLDNTLEKFDREWSAIVTRDE
jgi:polar amino acid transport system substrate-binding protein